MEHLVRCFFAVRGPSGRPDPGAISARPETRWSAVRTAGKTSVLIILASTALFCSAQQSAKNTNARPNEALAARGRYIVEGVARCEQCHTPRDASGNPDSSQKLEGAPVWLKSAELTENWPTQAPRLAGNPPGTDEEMVRLLTTGVWKDGKYLRQPMPQFRMTSEDAEAVVAYLKSLSPGTK